MKIQDNNGQFRLTLPKSISLLKGLHQGKKVAVVLNENNDVAIKDYEVKGSKKRVQDNNGQFRITIPKSIALMKNWKQGTEVVIVLAQNGDLILKEIKNEKK